MLCVVQIWHRGLVRLERFVFMYVHALAEHLLMAILTGWQMLPYMDGVHLLYVGRYYTFGLQKSI